MCVAHVGSVLINPRSQGRSQFRICRFPRGKQRGALTESCFSKFVLKQASGAQRGYDWWYHRDSSDQTTTLQLPSNLGCNGSDYRCVLQYRYQAGTARFVAACIAAPTRVPY